MASAGASARRPRHAEQVDNGKCWCSCTAQLDLDKENKARTTSWVVLRLQTSTGMSCEQTSTTRHKCECNESVGAGGYARSDCQRDNREISTTTKVP